MKRLSTLRELFRHNDWARERLMSLAKDTADDALDRPFEMGVGTLRKTLHHLWAAERIWLDRWVGVPQPKFVEPEPGLPLSALGERFVRTAHERNTWMDQRSDGDLDTPLTFSNTKGETYTFPFGPMLLHVCNHGVHHRAQAVNMLRHAGVKPPRLDYIFMKVEQPSPTPPVQSLAIIRDYYAYTDWAHDRMLKAAEGLDNALLDRSFAMGMGTLRKTLVHIRDAEQWWFDNWVNGPTRLFPPADETISIPGLWQRYRQAIEARNAYLARMNDEDLKKPVSGQPAKDVFRNFTLGETMLQLCGHGTHHRAQALNMLRHVGVTPPGMDYILFVRETQAAPKL